MALVDAAYLSAHRSQLIRPREIEAFSKSDPDFTPLAKRALFLAGKEAERLSHNWIATEHLLLGLIALGQGVAVTVLEKLGVNLDTVRMELEKQAGPGVEPKARRDLGYTPRAKKVMALAAKEQRALNHKYLGTEHILLGLLHEGHGVAAQILDGLDIKLDQTRNEVLKELDPNYNG
jgi:ATP-dependent Clp protease ATP-binding subunit ClpC